MPTALITGIAGFGGSHLADLLLSQEWTVAGIASPTGNRRNILHCINRLNFAECDMRDRERLQQIITDIRPDAVFHLAAKTVEQETRTQPRLAFEVTVLGTMHLLDAIRAAGLTQTRVLIAGSSAEYGQVKPEENPIRESQPMRPVGMYGVTKISQGMLALQYHLTHQMPSIRTIAFNHTGPRQPEQFATPAFARQIAQIEAGQIPPVLKVGDLSHRRDISDVRDVVRGYLAAITHGLPGELYNIASGSAVKTEDVLLQLVGRSKVKIEITTDLARLRPADVPVQIGDATKLKNRTGWKPDIPLEQTLDDTLHYWRERVTNRDERR